MHLYVVCNCNCSMYIVIVFKCVVGRLASEASEAVGRWSFRSVDPFEIETRRNPPHEYHDAFDKTCNFR